MSLQSSRILNTFSPTVNAAVISAIVAFAVSGWLIPKIQREQKLADRQYEAISEVAVANANYYQSIWNVYFGLSNNEDTEARRHYRDQMQAASAQAEGIKAKLAILFRDSRIVEDWQLLMQVYGRTYYPLGRGENLSEATVNQMLTDAAPLWEALSTNMRQEIEMSFWRKVREWFFMACRNFCEALCCT